MNIDPRRTVSINKAAELTGVKRRTIYNWMSTDKVDYTRTAGGAVRIFDDALERIASASIPSAGKTRFRMPSASPSAGRDHGPFR